MGRERTRRGIRTGLVLVGSLGLGGVPIGCYRTALDPNGQRTQFDRYDQTRNNYVAPYLQDEFGRRTPNLRGRLLTRD